MFTGIIQATALILQATPTGGGVCIRFKRPRRWRLTRGMSINVDGICSTVVLTHGTYFDVVYMPETMKKTTAASFAPGQVVNLERSLTLTQPLDGNIVSGHVDARGRVMKILKQGDSRVITFALPVSLGRCIAPRGSIVINGVSLTVAKKVAGSCTVALIPYTLTHTNLGSLKRGAMVNIEADLLARYVVNALEHNLFIKEQYAKKRKA